MIKKIALVFVIVSLMVAPAVLAGNGANQGTSEHVSASAETSSGDYIGAYAGEYGDGYTYVDIYGYFNGNDFYCYGYDLFGIVDVIGSAKHGTIEVETADLNCYYGTPPTNISAECIANGQHSEHYTGNGKTTYGDGTTYKWHGNTKSEQADCTIIADSLLYNQINHWGWLEHRNEVYK